MVLTLSKVKLVYIKVGSFIQIVAQNRLQDKISFKQTEIVRGKLNLISLHITLSADLLMGGIFGSLWSVAAFCGGGSTQVIGLRPKKSGHKLNSGIGFILSLRSDKFKLRYENRASWSSGSLTLRQREV